MSRGERDQALLQERFDATSHVLDAYLQERPFSRFTGAETDYAAAELDRARDVLMPPRLVDGPLHALGITVALGSVRTDGSGVRLEIVVEPPGVPVDLDRARRAVRALVDVPVEVVAGQPVVPARGWAGAAGGCAAV